MSVKISVKNGKTLHEHQVNQLHLAIRCTSLSKWGDLTKEKRCSEQRIHLETRGLNLHLKNGFMGGQPLYILI